MFGKKKIDKNIRKLLKQYGCGMAIDSQAHLCGRVDISDIENWKRYRTNRYPDIVYVTLEKAIDIVKNSKYRFFDCFGYLPAELVDYLQSEVGEEKADLERDVIRFR